MLLSIFASSIVASLLWATASKYHCTGVSCYVLPAVIVALLHIAWLALYNIVLYPYYVSPLRHLPSPRQAPFHRRLFREPNYGRLVKWINEVPNDGLIRYHGVLNAERVLVTKTSGCKDVLQTNAYDYIKLPWALEVMGQFAPGGILVAPPAKHRHDRKLLQPAFKFRNVKELSPTFWIEGAKFLAAIEKQIVNAGNGLVDIGERLHHVTLDVITLTAFGASVNAVDDPDSSTVKHFRNIFASKSDHLKYRALAFLIPSWIYRRLPVQAKRDIMTARDVIIKFLRPLIQERRQHARDGASTQYARSDIIETLLQSGANCSDDYLIDQSINFLVAGHETTATAAAMTLYSLSQHPDVQTRLREEIQAKLPSPSSNAKVDSELIESLPYLVAVCNEVLRLYSPAVYAHRQTVAPNVKVGEVHIPVGTVVTVAPGLIHECHQIWGPKAQEFDPERWLVKAGGELKVDPLGGTNDPYAVMPFTYGPRQCIGERFARGELMSLVAQLVGRFEWEFKGLGKNGDKPMRIVHAVVAGPLGGRMTMHAKRIGSW